MLCLVATTLLTSASAYAQCTGCTTTITGADAGTYTANPGDRICINAGADFTGMIRLYGGELYNCATNPQDFSMIFSLSTPSGCGDSNTNITDGEYVVAQVTNAYGSNNVDWTLSPDNTGNPNGRMLVINAINAPNIMYRRPIYNFTKNVDLLVGFAARNTILPGYNLVLPDITVEFEDQDGNILLTEATGTLPEDDTWHDFNFTVNPGNTDTVYIVLRNNAGAGSGNDLAIDDIRAVHVVADFDDDGIPNQYDLDSDNDGVYDSEEAEHAQAQNNGEISGGVDSEGIPNAVSDGNSGVNYSYTNSGASAVIDPYELDSDADGCYDVVEAGYTDQDNDGILGPAPISVDPVTGLVTSGGT